MDVLPRIFLTLLFITFITIFTVVAQVSYYGLCANPTCSVPIGRGMAILKYQPGEHDRIRLDIKQEFDIFVQDYGEKKNLFGVMINGVKGYVPKNVVQEQRRFVKEVVPADVEFMHTNVGNPNQGDSQVHFSMSRQEVIHHVSPDSYSQQQNYHSNYLSEDYYDYPSDGDWSSENSHIYSSPHVHVISSHVEATVTSQTSNVAQHPNTWESTSHIQAAPENSVHSSYRSGDQQATNKNIPPLQQYSESTYTNENQQPATHQKITPQQQYSESKYTNENQQQATYQKPAPEMHSQSAHSNEYPHSSQFPNVLQTSFSSETQNNLQYAQNSLRDQIHASNTAGTEAQNYAHSPQVESSYSSYTTESRHSPDGSVSSQYSSQNLKGGQTYYMSSYASSEVKPPIDIPATIAALKAQGYDEGELNAYFYGDTSDLNPSHTSHSGEEAQVSGHEHSSQLKHPSETERNQNFNLQQPSIPSQVVSSEEVFDYQSSSVNFHSGGSQFQQPPGFSESHVSESSRLVLQEVLGADDEDDSSEAEVDIEDENLEENDSNEVAFSVVEKSASFHPEKEENAPSPFPKDALQSLEKKMVEQTSSSSESNTPSPSPVINLESISESKVSVEYQQSTTYPHLSQSKFVDDTEKKVVTSDGKVSDKSLINDNSNVVSIPDATISPNVLVNNTIDEKAETIDALDIIANISKIDDTESDHDNNGIFFDNIGEILHPENINETDVSSDKGQSSDLEKILNISELNEAEQSGYLNAYQIRNLKGEQENKDNQNPETLDDVGGQTSSLEFNLYDYIENTIVAIRSFVEVLLLWIPEPLYSTIMELETKGISPRVPVFTALSAIPCLFLIVALVYLKEKSKEQKLIVQLAFAEKNVYTLSAEKNVLEEKLEKAEAELESCKTTLITERKFYDDLKAEVVNLNQELEESNLELESKVEEIKSLQEKEKQFAKLIADNEKAHLELVEEKNQLNNQLSCQDETICQFNDQLHEREKEITELQEEKLQYSKANEVYEEKLTQLQHNCNQLLKEAEIWNLRVNELNTKLNEEIQSKQELEELLKVKDSEIESLTFLMESFKSFEELEDSTSEEYKTKQEKLQCLLKSANISIILQKQEEENKLVMQKLSEEKTKILDMEVELLEAKSEIDKLKLNYNQALQDKTEAQTKLEVLTNYFKDKEIQLQKQLGAQEVFREKREKDADSAERRIVLIEQENTSYKSQVASMKQEMEETERNLKSQIAAQEKKAHENWIAARAAERKLEDMKQEVTQLRQKLTLLERDQGNFINASRDDIIRPIPQRIAGVNDETINSQDINNSMDEPPSMYRMPYAPMMLPDMPRDRPLPPLPLPPFEPPPPMFAPPPFGPFPRDPMFNSEFRVTPPEFSRGRASTPPRGRQSAVNDNDLGPRQSSPLGSELRESRNSTPPHSLPDFHDIPPPLRPPFYPPHRFPFRPPFRREFPPGPHRPDYQSENPQGRGTQHSSVPQDSWTPSNSRV